MHILAIETTGAFASVAVTQDEKITASVHGHDRFSHLQNLMPQVQTVLKESKLLLGDIDAIAVSAGPGSFTGIRIGVSSARALSQALHVPCVAVPTLEALALNAAEREGSVDVLVCPILDARRSQVYGGGYYVNGISVSEEIKAGAYTIDEFLEKVNEYSEVIFFGDGADRYSEQIAELRPDGTHTAAESIRYQRAESVAKLGSKIFAAGGGVAYSDLQPNYMRIPEAERKLRAKLESEAPVSTD